MNTPEDESPAGPPADQPSTIHSAFPTAYPAYPTAAAAPVLPTDLQTPLNGFDLLVLAIFYFVAGAAITLLVAVVARRIFGMSRGSLQDSLTASAPLIIVSQALLSGAVFALLFGMVRSRGTADFWPSVGWRGFPGKGPGNGPGGGARKGSIAGTAIRYMLGGLILAALVGWASSYLDRNIVLPMEELLRDRQSVLLLTGLGVLVAPLFEETIFRGCVYPVLARRWGVGASVLVTGILFGAAHAPQLWPGYGQIALLMFVGVVLTYVRARSGTVAASYFVHLGYNTVFFAGFYFATGGLRHFPS